MPVTPPPATAPAAPPLELWGGVECTINRVRDRWFRQLERNGHLARPDDLERFAALGIRAVRYPVLWEQHVPASGGRVPPGPAGAVDWAWTDARLGGLRALGVRPIVGLVHHGSGPPGTSLVDPNFPARLAGYAEQVAERYPWVEDWTPVNEPLTTARFSALYGVWYPHARDPRAFARALVGQCRAVQLSMRAIRRVNPAARLVQTEDLGRVAATPPLAREAARQNARRWLSFDLLFGRVDRAHTMWPVLVGWGVGEAELDAFLADPCPPDVVGINHYLTSDRFLDHRAERYPPALLTRRHDDGRLSRVPFADVDAVRACPEGRPGVGPRLREAWARYGRPVAVTECHLGSTRDEQLRWLHETWRAAAAVRAEGADVRAVTVWSLLGAYDWNSLVTCDRGCYEPGPFDVRGPAPRPTALAALARQLADGDGVDDVVRAHPVLAQPGWWRRPDRICYPAAEGRSYAHPPGGTVGARPRDLVAADAGPGRPLLITGASGALGGAVARLCDVRGLPYHALTRGDLDVTDAGAVDAVVAALRPWAVVHCAGWGAGPARVEAAERAPAACLRATAHGAAAVAAACARWDARLVAFSSDLVFDGVGRAGPYLETDAPAPLGAYGRAHAELEAQVRDGLPGALVVRTAAVFGPWDAGHFVARALAALARGEPVDAPDATVSPTYVIDLVHATLDLLVDGEHGVWHLTNGAAVTWAELARRAAARAGVSARGVRAPRGPRRYHALGTARGQLLPPLDDALGRYLRHRGLAEADAARAAQEGGGGVAPGGGRGGRPWRYQQAAGWI